MFNECKCPIGKPFTEKHSLIKRHLFEAYGIPYNPNGMPSDKVLEILNAWNRSSALAGVEGRSYGKTDENGKFVKVTEQYPTRWVYFLDPPQWMKDAQAEHRRKFNIKWETNHAREKQDLQKYGMSLEWIYHQQLEGFILPLDICSRSPHYVDELPKDTEVEFKFEWDHPHWTCPECKNVFRLVDNWKTWVREDT